MLVILIVTMLVSLAAVLVHYESLLRLTSLMNRIHVRPRLRVVFAIVGALFAHVLEVWIFTIAYYFLVQSGRFGSLVGNFSGELRDYVYYSFSVYTSLGFGDIIPEGPIRYLTGMEALTGLVLIAWTASFMFVEMQRLWKP
jgi:hypothetical protein